MNLTSFQVENTVCLREVIWVYTFSQSLQFRLCKDKSFTYSEVVTRVKSKLNILEGQLTV